MNFWKEINPAVKILIAATAFFVSSSNLLAKDELKQKLDSLKKAGEPMTLEDIRPAPVPDQDNAAFIYEKIFILMTEQDKPFVMKKDCGSLKQQIDKLITYYSDQHLCEHKKAEINNLLTSKTVDKIIKLAKQAAGKPAANFDLKYEDGLNVLVPHLNHYRPLAKLLALKAQELASNHKPNAAIELCLVGLKLNSHIKNEPTLISQLVYHACNSITLKTLNDIIQKHGINNKQAKKIITFIREQNPRKYMKAAMRAERVLLMHSAFNPFLAGKLNDGEGKKLKPFDLLVKKDYLCYLDFMDRSIALYDKEYWQISAAEMDDKAWCDKIPCYCVNTITYTFPLRNPRIKTAQCQALFNKAILVMLLAKYKNEHGKYPALLDALGQDLPKDPFTGKDFSYQLLGKSYKLISAGDKKE